MLRSLWSRRHISTASLVSPARSSVVSAAWLVSPSRAQVTTTTTAASKAAKSSSSPRVSKAKEAAAIAAEAAAAASSPSSSPSKVARAEAAKPTPEQLQSSARVIEELLQSRNWGKALLNPERMHEERQAAITAAAARAAKAAALRERIEGKKKKILERAAALEAEQRQLLEKARLLDAEIESRVPSTNYLGEVPDAKQQADVEPDVDTQELQREEAELRQSLDGKKDAEARHDDDVNRVCRRRRKIRVGVLQPHPEGTWTDDSVRCSPAIYASDELRNMFTFTEFTIRKHNAYRKLRHIVSDGNKHIDVFWNLCDGARDEIRTGEDTIRVLESLNVPFTGADSNVFEPSKIDMKMLLAAAGIKTPSFAVLDRADLEGAAEAAAEAAENSDLLLAAPAPAAADAAAVKSQEQSGGGGGGHRNGGRKSEENFDASAGYGGGKKGAASIFHNKTAAAMQAIAAHVQHACGHLRFPVIVKHISGYGSIGITKDSKCADMDALVRKLKTFVQEFDVALVEEFITGEEGTVFVCADPSSPDGTGLHVFPPLMIPIPDGGEDFLHYGNKWKSSILEGERFDFYLRPDGSQPLPTEAAALLGYRKERKRWERLTRVLERRESAAAKAAAEDEADGGSDGSGGANTTALAVVLPPEPKLPACVLTPEQRAEIYRKVRQMAANAFALIMERVGYGRCDFRIDSKTNEPYFLEINPNCGIFLPDAKTGKPAPGEGDYADLMLQEDAEWGGASHFIKTQLEIAIRQNKARTPWWMHSYSAAQQSFITKAAQPVPCFARVFGDEVRPVPVVARALYDVLAPNNTSGAVAPAASAAAAAASSRNNGALLLNSHKNVTFLTEGALSHAGGDHSGKNRVAVDEAEAADDAAASADSSATMSASARGDGRGKSSIKVGCAVFRGDGLQTCVLLQHSCNPNCALVHSNTIELATIKPLAKGEPLSIDYSTLRDPAMPAFQCRCGAPGCRGWITPQSAVVRRRESHPSHQQADGAVVDGSGSGSGGNKKSRLLARTTKRLDAARREAVAAVVAENSQKRRQQQADAQREQDEEEESASKKKKKDEEVEPAEDDDAAAARAVKKEAPPPLHDPALPKKVVKKLAAVADSPLNQRALGLASVAPEEIDPPTTTKQGKGKASAAVQDALAPVDEIPLSNEEAHSSDSRTETIAREIARKTREILQQRAQEAAKRNAARKKLLVTSVTSSKKTGAASAASGGEGGGGSGGNVSDPVTNTIRQRIAESREKLNDTVETPEPKNDKKKG